MTTTNTPAPPFTCRRCGYDHTERAMVQAQDQGTVQRDGRVVARFSWVCSDTLACAVTRQARGLTTSW